jgi:hypothetical protein
MADEVAKAFVAHYYQTLDNTPEQLTGLFVRTVDILCISSIIRLCVLSLVKQAAKE